MNKLVISLAIALSLSTAPALASGGKKPPINPPMMMWYTPIVNFFL